MSTHNETADVGGHANFKVNAGHYAGTCSTYNWSPRTKPESAEASSPRIPGRYGEVDDDDDDGHDDVYVSPTWDRCVDIELDLHVGNPRDMTQLLISFFIPTSSDN